MPGPPDRLPADFKFDETGSTTPGMAQINGKWQPTEIGGRQEAPMQDVSGDLYAAGTAAKGALGIARAIPGVVKSGLGFVGSAASNPAVRDIAGLVSPRLSHGLSLAARTAKAARAFGEDAVTPVAERAPIAPPPPLEAPMAQPDPVIQSRSLRDTAPRPINQAGRRALSQPPETGDPSKVMPVRPPMGINAPIRPPIAPRPAVQAGDPELIDALQRSIEEAKSKPSAQPNPISPVNPSIRVRRR